MDDKDKKRVLIVDDEEDFAQIVKLNLEGTGKYIVRTETKGARGLPAALEFRPHIILLDILMLDIEGTEVASRIRKNEEIKDIPIIFVTAALTKEEADSQQGYISGFPFIAKPVNVNQLILCIEKSTNK